MIKYLLLFLCPLVALADDASIIKRLPEFFPDTRSQAFAKEIVRSDIGKIKQLIESGVNINMPGEKGLSFLVVALLRKKKEVFSCLLEHGANPNAPGDSMWKPAIFFAVGSEDTWWLQEILRHGGDVNTTLKLGQKMQGSGQSPLFEIVNVESPTARAVHLKALLAAGANINQQDYMGNSALVHAVHYDRYDVVYELLQSGADPTLKNKFGFTLVYSMIEYTQPAPRSTQGKWRERVVKILKDKGIDVPPAKRVAE